jgi:hypothetical protein
LYLSCGDLQGVPLRPFQKTFIVSLRVGVVEDPRLAESHRKQPILWNLSLAAFLVASLRLRAFALKRKFNAKAQGPSAAGRNPTFTTTDTKITKKNRIGFLHVLCVLCVLRGEKVLPGMREFGILHCKDAKRWKWKF